MKSWRRLRVVSSLVFEPPLSWSWYCGGTLVIKSVAPVRSAATRAAASGIGLKTMWSILGRPFHHLGLASKVAASSRFQSCST